MRVADAVGLGRLSLFRFLLTFYEGAPLRVRARLFLRVANCPLDRIGPMVGTLGPVLDLGCGCGFATALLAEGSRRTVVGADHDVYSLRNAAGAVRSARFVRASAHALPFRGIAAILVADVLYLLSPEEQARALTECRRALLPGGLLVLKTTDDRPRWKHWWNVVQEWVVVRALHLTKGAGSLTFRGGRGYEELLRSSGFEIEECIDLGAGYLHPHIVIRARRPR